MIPRALAALAALLSVLTKAHLSLTILHLTVTVSIPWALSAIFVTVLAVMLWIIWRNVRGFKSSPRPRPRFST
jgi:hypothetical protein